jgi:hypothetical protein
MITGPLVAMATGKCSMQDHMPRPVRPITSRVRWAKERHCGYAQRGREMQRSCIASDKSPAPCDQGG